MKTKREYADLADAIRENDTQKTNELMGTLLPRLKRFLKVHMNASRSDAEDCAQETILSCLEVIREDRLRNPDRVLSYLLTSCRNNYLKMKEKQKEDPLEEISEHYTFPAEQLTELLDKERYQILKWCMKQLKEEYQRFMEYWFRYPDSEAEKVAEHFDLSVSNTWTRKHRIINKLNECYSEKSKL